MVFTCRRKTVGHWNAPREGEIEGDHHFEARDPRAASVFPVRSRRKLSRRKLGSSNMLMSGAPQTNRWSGSDSAFSQPPGWTGRVVGHKADDDLKRGLTEPDHDVSWRRKKRVRTSSAISLLVVKPVCEQMFKGRPVFRNAPLAVLACRYFSREGTRWTRVYWAPTWEPIVPRISSFRQSGRCGCAKIRGPLM